MTLEELVTASTLAALRGIPQPTVLDDGRLFWEVKTEVKSYELDAFLKPSRIGFTVYSDFYFRDPDVAPKVRWRRFKRTYKKLHFAFRCVQKSVRIAEGCNLRGFWTGTVAPDVVLAWRASRRRPTNLSAQSIGC